VTSTNRGYLSLPAAARAVRISQRRLLDAIHRNELRARLHEGHWYVSPDELQRWRQTRRLLERAGGGAA